jgi:hypothetical protein
MVAPLGSGSTVAVPTMAPIGGNKGAQRNTSLTVSRWKEGGPNNRDASAPAPVTVRSGREVEWPQIGIGFGIGIALMFGLYLVVRTPRDRQLAH